MEMIFIACLLIKDQYVISSSLGSKQNAKLSLKLMIKLLNVWLK